MFAATKSFFAKTPPSGGGPTPAWSIDWSTGTPSGYTLTRASSGTYVDSSGYVASASTDVARLTHNSSGNRLGLLVEGSSTNLCHRSELIGNWTLIGVTVTANSTAAPDNTTTADTLVENTAAGNHRASSNIATVTANQVRTATCYVKAAGRDYCALILYGTGGTTSRFGQVFDLTGSGSLGSTNTQNSPTNTSASITDVGNGWFRIMAQMQSSDTSCQISVTASDSATPTFASTAPTYTGNGANALYVWGGQLEDAATATAYIPTPSTASVTRSADLAHVLDSSITSWGDPGALVIHFYPPVQAGALLSTDDASAEQLGLQASSTTAARAFWSNGDTSTGTIAAGVNKAVHYWSGTASSFCINGGTVQTGTNNVTTFGNIDFVTFGAEATDSSGSPGTFSQWPNLVIRKIEFYAGTLSSSDLQTITT
jgi:hypothetical protein